MQQPKTILGNVTQQVKVSSKIMQERPNGIVKRLNKIMFRPNITWLSLTIMD